MTMAPILFEKFQKILELCNTAPDQKMLNVLLKEFDNTYKRCNEDTQGEYHYMVADFMQGQS